MTIRTHIADLREKQAAYRRLLASLEAGKITSADALSDDARMRDLQSKISELDGVIAAEEAKRIQANHPRRSSVLDLRQRREPNS